MCSGISFTEAVLVILPSSGLSKKTELHRFPNHCKIWTEMPIAHLNRNIHRPKSIKRKPDCYYIILSLNSVND